VVRAYLGTSAGQELTVEQAGDATLRVGWRGLVDAFRDEGVLKSGRSCQPFSSVDPEFQKFLERWKAGRTETTVTVSVTMPDQSRPAGAQVGLRSGDARVFWQETSAAGHAVFTGIPPGKYILDAEVAGYRMGAEAEVDVIAGTCPSVFVPLTRR
jgi:hypothetical protein